MIYFPAYRSHDIYTHATNSLVDQIKRFNISLFPYELSTRKKKNQFSNMIGKRFCSPAGWRWDEFCLISQLQLPFTSKSATNFMISILRMPRVRVHTNTNFEKYYRELLKYWFQDDDTIKAREDRAEGKLYQLVRKLNVFTDSVSHTLFSLSFNENV